MDICPICGAPKGACKGEADLVLPAVSFIEEAKPRVKTPEEIARMERVQAAMNRRKAQSQ